MKLAIDSPLADDFDQIIFGDRIRTKPVNLQTRSNDEIQAAAQYAMWVATNVGKTLSHYDIELRNRSLLEIGPGIGFGSTLLLGEQCSTIGVLDAYLAPWQKRFHPILYRAISQLLGRRSQFLDRVISAGKHRGIVVASQEPADSMRSVRDGSYEVVISNAVLEHVGPLSNAIRETYRVTKPGGDGFHQVDFRCHRNFDWPLEHLLLTKDQFKRVFEATHGEVGCQYRVAEVAEFFRAAGFEIRDVYVNMSAESEYVSEFEPRLRQSASEYRNWPIDEVSKVSASFCVRKPV